MIAILCTLFSFEQQTLSFIDRFKTLFQDIHVYCFSDIRHEKIPKEWKIIKIDIKTLPKYDLVYPFLLKQQKRDKYKRSVEKLWININKLQFCQQVFEINPEIDQIIWMDIDEFCHQNTIHNRFINIKTIKQHTNDLVVFYQENDIIKTNIGQHFLIWDKPSTWFEGPFISFSSFIIPKHIINQLIKYWNTTLQRMITFNIWIIQDVVIWNNTLYELDKQYTLLKYEESIVETIKWPLVSVIIPTYNRFNYLIQVVQSILKSTYPAIEIWIIDDASTDKRYLTLDNVFNDYRINIYRCEVNKRILYQSDSAQGLTRNEGLKRCKGDFICFCDDDDYMADPNKIQFQVECLTQLKERFQMISTNSWKGEGVYPNPSYDSTFFLDDHWNLETRPKFEFQGKLCYEWYLQDFQHDNMIINSSVMITREMFKKAGFQELVQFEDMEYWKKILKYTSCIYVHSPMVAYDLNHGNGIEYTKDEPKTSIESDEPNIETE